MRQTRSLTQQQSEVRAPGLDRTFVQSVAYCSERDPILKRVQRINFNIEAGDDLAWVEA